MGEDLNDITYPKQQGIIGEVITLILGILLVSIPYGVLKDMLFTFVGIGIIIMNILPCIISWMKAERNRSYLYLALAYTLLIIVGMLFIFWHHWMISIILGIWLVVFPILRIIKIESPSSRLEQFKKEVPFFIIAILLFLLPVEAILAIALKVLGGIMIGISIIFIIYILIMNAKNNKKDKNDENPNSENKDRIIIDAEVKDLE